MLAKGLTLMLTGMGTVFVFLCVMVLAMTGAAAFFKRFAHRFPDDRPEESHIERIKKDETVEIAVAIAAVESYRK